MKFKNSKKTQSHKGEKVLILSFLDFEFFLIKGVLLNERICYICRIRIF